MDLIAYPVVFEPGLTLEPSPMKRDWMDATRDKHAYRCLPLAMANQSGWVVRQRGTFTATWVTDEQAGVAVAAKGACVPPTSHFGHGLLTWDIPWVFRTPPGWNLLLRGPVNLPKDGVYPLEGILETDWMTQGTTYSVKMTRRHRAVTYEDGEPVATIVPVRRDDLEEWTPRILPMPPDLDRELDAFIASRQEFIKSPEHAEGGWERDYHKGTSPGGSSAPQGEHRTTRRLKPFKEEQ